MTLFTRQTARGRCPCGAEHAACGPPSTVTPIDIQIEEVAVVGGPLNKYRYTNEAGHQTILKLNEADARQHGLTDADLVDAPAPEPEPAAKARPAAANKARTSARNKGGGGGGD